MGSPIKLGLKFRLTNALICRTITLHLQPAKVKKARSVKITSIKAWHMTGRLINYTSVAQGRFLKLVFSVWRRQSILPMPAYRLLVNYGTPVMNYKCIFIG